MIRGPEGRVLVIGDYYADLVFTGLPHWPRPGEETFATETLSLPGGAYTHVRALHRLGVTVCWAAELGNDPYSRLVLDAAAEDGLDSSAWTVHDRPMRNVSVAASYEGERGFISYKEPSPPRDHTRLIHDQRPAVVLMVEMPTADRLTTVTAAAEAVGAQLVLDPQHTNLTVNDHLMRRTLQATDVFMPNAAEARQITGCDRVDDAVDLLVTLTSTVVVKNGSHGAVAAQRDRRAAARAPDVAAIDTIGAGDCFDAGFVAGLVNSLPLQASLELGVLCGSLSTLDYGGGGAPTLSQLARQAPHLVPWADHHPLEGKDQR